MPTERRTQVSTNATQDRASINEDEVRRIVEMYQATDEEGEPKYTLADITQATRRPRGTIYWVLREAGIVPKRIRRTPKGAPTVETLLAENAGLRDELSQLRLDLERERSVNTRLMKLLAAIEEAEKPGQRPRAAKKS